MAHCCVCNVYDEESVNALVAKTKEDVGIIDILVNNAGIIRCIPMLDMTAAEFRQVIDAELNAHFIAARSSTSAP